MMGAPNLIAENMDCGLSYSVISYLKKLSQQVKPYLMLDADVLGHICVAKTFSSSYKKCLLR